MSQEPKRVDMRVNPLYPDRIESNAAGVLIALASMAVAIICLVLIVSNFSYAVRPASSSVYTGTTYPSDQTAEDSYEEDEAIMADEAEDTGETYAEDESVTDGTADAEAAQTEEYVIADSNSRYLERSDLEGLSAEQLRIARNEIYARHGRMFDDQTLQAYFDSKSWYSGTISPADFSEDILNDFERQNTYTITDYEIEMGYR